MRRRNHVICLALLCLFLVLLRSRPDPATRDPDLLTSQLNHIARRIKSLTTSSNVSVTSSYKTHDVIRTLKRQHASSQQFLTSADRDKDVISSRETNDVIRSRSIGRQHTSSKRVLTSADRDNDVIPQQTNKTEEFHERRGRFVHVCPTLDIWVYSAYFLFPSNVTGEGGVVRAVSLASTGEGQRNLNVTPTCHLQLEDGQIVTSPGRQVYVGIPPNMVKQ